MGLFNHLRRKQIGRDESVQISGLRLKIRSGKEALPPPLIGAYVTAFTVADKQEQAVKQAVLAVFGMGYDVEEVLPEGLEFRASDWGAHIAKAWPDFLDHFPAQAAIAGSLKMAALYSARLLGLSRQKPEQRPQWVGSGRHP